MATESRCPTCGAPTRFVSVAELREGTPAAPDTRDCYHRAEEGEPKFTLLARDPLSPAAVLDWADRAERKGWQPAERITDAREVAAAMDVWRRERRPEKPEYAPVVPELPALLARAVVQWRKGESIVATRQFATKQEIRDAEEWLKLPASIPGPAFVGAVAALAALSRVLPAAPEETANGG